jgi:hypothetical protein
MDSGTVLIAARKAYFEYQSFETQARLFNVIKNSSISFSRLSLKRWKEKEFLDYCRKRNVSDGKQLYDDVVSVLTAEHPVITRAVLAKGLVEVAATADKRRELLTALHDTPPKIFTHFVNTIIRREAEEKWIDRSSGDVLQPLLTPKEHNELLGEIALEMWNSSTDSVTKEIINTIVEIYCESKSKGVVINRQICERIKDHALIACDVGGRMFRFDHEEFKYYFIGWRVARYIEAWQASDTRRVLRMAPLPKLSVDTIIGEISPLNNESRNQYITWLQDVCKTDGVVSYLNENSGDIIIRLLDHYKADLMKITGVTFPSESLEGRQITDAVFDKCYFQPTTLENAVLSNCKFEKCTFDRIEMPSNRTSITVELVDCTVRSIVHVDKDFLIFDPAHIQHVMNQYGIRTIGGVPTDKIIIFEDDENLVQVQRAIRVFMRATEVNEYVLRQRLGKYTSLFFTDILPLLIKHDIFREVAYQGGGKQRRFRLVPQMTQIQDALSRCRGQFQEFMCILGGNQKNKHK